MTTAPTQATQAPEDFNDAVRGDVRTDSTKPTHATIDDHEEQASPKEIFVKARSIHANFPLVVCYQEGWYEISCPVSMVLHNQALMW